MNIQSVKGTRDFYPEDMARRNFIADLWKKVSIRNGFVEYDGPIFEYLAMYQQKSGDEIASQLFAFEDRGGRMLAIRPEITPTLARMVNQRINALPKPIKWFSVPRLCRAERPQKGRLREFFQWNIDIIGEDSVLADAEVILTAVDYLREVGLTSNDIKVKISSRKLLAAILRGIGVPEEKLNSVYVILDKFTKLPADTFSSLLTEQVGSELAGQIIEFMGKSFNNLLTTTKQNKEIEDALAELANCRHCLEEMGIGNYCVFDQSIVRGLAYYTGIVFEIHDIQGDLRAICGGGRYDNLLHDFGGPKVSATGMGMGDCVLEILLREKGLLDKNISANSCDYFIIPINYSYFDASISLTAKLRQKGFKSIFSYKTAGFKRDESPVLSKLLKEASAVGAAKCIIIGDEYQTGQLVVKNMTDGSQQNIAEKDFFDGLRQQR